MVRRFFHPDVGVGDRSVGYAVKISVSGPGGIIGLYVDLIFEQRGRAGIDLVYLGTCTGGRTKDYAQALAVLRAGGGIAPGVRVVVTPASEAVRAELQASGMLAEFLAFGAEVRAPGCGACCGISNAYTLTGADGL